MDRFRDSDSATPGPSPAGRRDSTRDPERAWHPDLYLRFDAARHRPAMDLLDGAARMGAQPTHVVDLGCGAGGAALAMADRWPDAGVTGIDHSAAMLGRARDLVRETDRAGRVRWMQADVGDLQGWRARLAGSPPPDMLFSNACLHWLADHATLFPRLLDALPSRGVLAVQMPRSWDLPSHRSMRETLAALATTDPAIDVLIERLSTPPVHDPADYHRWLGPLADRLDIWTTEYLQALEPAGDGRHPVYAWVESTGLRPVRDALRGDRWRAFDIAYRKALEAAYPPESDGRVLFPFPRLFVVARRA